MNTVLRIALFAAAGWLAGEMISRTLLAAPAPIPSPRVPAMTERTVRRSHWQEFLSAHTTSRAAVPLTAAEVSAAPLGTLDGILAISQRLTTASLEDFPAILDSIAAIKDIRLRHQAAEVLFAAWAEKDPLAAMAAVNTWRSVAEPALIGTLRTWAERDPRALLAWLRTNNAAGGWARVNAEQKAVPFLVNRCPEDTMALGVELGPGSNLLYNAFPMWHAKDPAAADAWSAAVPQDVRKRLAKALDDAQKGPMRAAN
jgi:hypothetical protein